MSTPPGATTSARIGASGRGPSKYTVHGSPLTTASTRPMPRSASSSGSEAAAPVTTSTPGCRGRSAAASRSLTSTASWRPRPPSRSAIAAVKTPVPGPSSTTTGSPAAGSPTTVRVVSAAELGTREAVRSGFRRNSRANRARAPPARGTDTGTEGAAGEVIGVPRGRERIRDQASEARDQALGPGRARASGGRPLPVAGGRRRGSSPGMTRPSRAPTTVGTVRMTWLTEAVSDRRGPVRLLPLLAGPGYLLLVQVDQPTPADWAFALAATLVFLPGGYAPLSVLVAESALLVGANVLADATPVVVKVAACVALVELAARRVPRVALLGGLVLAAAHVVVHLRCMECADAVGIGYVLVVLVAAPLLLGCWLRAVSQNLAQAQARAREAEERRELAALGARLAERGELARELHDLVAHHVASMALRAGVAREVLPDLDPRVRAVLDDVHGSATTALVDLRRLVAVLRDPASVTDPTRSLLVEPAELPVAIASVVERSGRHGLVVDSRVDPGVAGLDALRGLVVLRVVQEGLTNVARHAGVGTSTRVSVALADGAAHVEIRDAGDGTPAPDRLLVASGYGLEGLRERVALLGGSVTAGPDGPGWRLRATVPAGADPVDGAGATGVGTTGVGTTGLGTMPADGAPACPVARMRAATSTSTTTGGEP